MGIAATTVAFHWLAVLSIWIRASAKPLSSGETTACFMTFSASFAATSKESF